MIAGIDPGLSGAVAFLDSTIGQLLDVADMPILAIVRGKARRHDLDGHALLRLIQQHRPEHAYLEAAQAMPKQSSYSTGIFFQVYGEIRGILIGAGVAFTIVQPLTWKRALKVPAGKDAARARASQLLPAAAHLWPLKKHDGRAEAALLALYGSRSLGLTPFPASQPRGKRPGVAARAAQGALLFDGESR